MPARQDSKVTRKQVGERLRRARIREALSQKELADKIAVSQATVSLWESGRHPVQAEDQTRLTNILGDFIHEAAVDAREAEAKGGSAFGAWLSKTRTEKGMSVPELASKSGITAPAIYNIESGKSLNPQKETRRRLEQALGASIPADVTKEAERAQEIKGLGSLTDFDPYDEQNLPAVAGVYVFYDIAERPIYVGKAAIIASRVKEHKEKFWFRPPIVINAAYVPVSDATVRHQIEQVLIKFLKSNAVINRQSVERDSGS